MRNRVLAIFTTWPFVLALAVLLVNDALLKQAYPGFITGKLSDFAGFAVVALPLFAAFPRHTRAIYLALIGAFLWWKSPAVGHVHRIHERRAAAAHRPHGRLLGPDCACRSARLREVRGERSHAAS